MLPLRHQKEILLCKRFCSSVCGFTPPSSSQQHELEQLGDHKHWGRALMQSLYRISAQALCRSALLMTLLLMRFVKEADAAEVSDCSNQLNNALYWTPFIQSSFDFCCVVHFRNDGLFLFLIYAL